MLKRQKIVKCLIKNEFSGQDDWIKTVFENVIKITSNATQSTKVDLYQKGRRYVENYNKYGHVTWYTWCVEYWGSKWNAYNTNEINEDMIEFKTAYNYPAPVISKLSKIYPDITIEHYWKDEDMGVNSGYRIYHNGEIIEEEFYESDVNEFC